MESYISSGVVTRGQRQAIYMIEKSLQSTRFAGKSITEARAFIGRYRELSYAVAQERVNNELALPLLRTIS